MSNGLSRAQHKFITTVMNSDTDSTDSQLADYITEKLCVNRADVTYAILRHRNALIFYDTIVAKLECSRTNEIIIHIADNFGLSRSQAGKLLAERDYKSNKPEPK